MSRKKLKSKDKVTTKMSRDGLTLRNAATGAEELVGKRESQVDFSGKQKQSDTLSQFGTRTDGNKTSEKQSRAYRQSQDLKNADTTVVQDKGLQFTVKDEPVSIDNPVKYESSSIEGNNAVTGTDEHIGNSEPQINFDGKGHESDTMRQNGARPGISQSAAKKNRIYRQNDTSINIENADVKPDKGLQFTAKEESINNSVKHETPIQSDEMAESPVSTDFSEKSISESALSHEPRHSQTKSRRFNPRPPQGKGKRYKLSEQAAKAENVTKTQPDEKTVQTDTEAIQTHSAEKPKTRTLPPEKVDMSDTPPASDKPGKLKFTNDESTADTLKLDKYGKKLKSAQRKSDKVNTKLDKAQKKLPTKKKLRVERTFDEKKSKPKRKLHFETEVKTQGQHLKGALPLRPVKAAGNAIGGYVHKKIFQVERENVGTEAAHKTELAVEGATRSILRHRKLAPYRKVAKLEKKAVKKSIKLSYQRAIAENPKLRSNMLSRYMQKRKIKKQYAKAAREAQKAGKRAKRTGSAVGSATKVVVNFAKSHPMAAGIIVLALLLVLVIYSMVSSVGSLTGSGGMGILATSYVAADADVDNAELIYTEWETNLQIQIANVQSSRPGYDEYRYSVGDIRHNPYELMAYLTAVHQNFQYANIQAELQAIFAEQYVLTFTESTETRGEGESAYQVRILTTTLTARSFSDVVFLRMNEQQRQAFNIYIQSKGNRQYVGSPFDFNWLVYVTDYYGWRTHPTSGAKDYHKGIDIGVPTGTDIHAGMDGKVTTASYDSGGFGYYVVIEGANNLVAKYAHCDSLLVSAGQTVKKGDVIAKSGNTGNSTGAHLHMEVLKNGQYLNPLYFATTNDKGGLPIYGNPGSAMGDGSYAALIAEGEKYLGYPYVFGGSSPATSFDCSGFVCWVYTKSGAYNLPRTTAQGIYNQCTPIAPSEAKPGDLIFFERTYSCPDRVTHIGIYVGNGMMLHCGSPIQYVSVNGSYWSSHFFSYGRLGV